MVKAACCHLLPISASIQERKKSQYFRVPTLVGKGLYLKSKQEDSKVSVIAAQSPYVNEMEHILK